MWCLHFWLDQFLNLCMVVSSGYFENFWFNKLVSFKFKSLISHFKFMRYLIIYSNNSWCSFFWCFFNFRFVNWLKSNKIFLSQLIGLIFQKFKIKFDLFRFKLHYIEFLLLFFFAFKRLIAWWFDFFLKLYFRSIRR